MVPPPPVRIRDLLPDYLAYERAATGLPEQQWARFWESRYRRAHSPVFAVLERQGSLPGEAGLTDALRRLRRLGPDLARRAGAARALLSAVVGGATR